MYIHVLILLLCTSTHATIIIRGNETTSPFAFTAPIASTVFDRLTGRFFTGSAFDSTSSIQTFSLARANRPRSTIVNRFTPLATNEQLTNIGAPFLTLSAPVQGSSLLITAPQITEDPFANNIVSAIIPTNPTQVLQTTTINETSGSTPTPGIIALNATDSAIVAAVRGVNEGGLPQPFGIGSSGLALITINRTQRIPQLTVLNAQTGASGNQAIPFNDQSLVLRPSTSNPVSFSQEESDINQLALFTDPRLGRTFIGTRILTGINNNDIARGIALARIVNINNDPSMQQLQLMPIVQDEIFNQLISDNFIIINQGAQEPITIKRLATMHTSTGLTYLIINGNITDSIMANMFFFAIPMIDNPDSPLHATLADPQAPLVNGVFQTPPASVTNLARATDIATQVGNGPLPLTNMTDPINQMIVHGDTIFVAPGGQTQTGIFYSQALFGADGKIIRWTPWALRATSQTIFESAQQTNPTIADFTIDPTTGTITAIDEQTRQTVATTSFTKSNTSGSLTHEVSQALPNGVFAILDLNSATRGLQNQPHRFALFSSSNQVAFVRTSVQENPTMPETVITDFSNPQNFLITNLDNAGPITSLEYTKQAGNATNNYFFAIAQNGLYAFAQPNGQGFNSMMFADLSQPPLSSGAWQKITASSLQGRPIALNTAGNNIYIIANQPSRQSPLGQYTLYSIAPQTTLEQTFSPSNVHIIAQTGTGIFSSVVSFFDIQIVATGQEDLIDMDPIQTQKEQLVLATNQGLFVSQANQTNNNTGITSVISQTEAEWQLIEETGQTAFTALASINTPISHTVFPIAITDNGQRTFDRTAIFHLSGQGDATGMQALFSPIMRFAQQSSGPLASFDPIISFQPSGSRNFVIVQSPTTAARQLGIINTSSSIPALSIINDPIIAQQERLFAVQPLGATGLLAIGTNTGLITLS